MRTWKAVAVTKRYIFVSESVFSGQNKVNLLRINKDGTGLTTLKTYGPPAFTDSLYLQPAFSERWTS